MLTPATTDSLWSVIRRLERTLAEQGRRGTPASNPAQLQSAPSSVVVAQPLAAATAPLTWRPETDDWSTVFESITPMSRQRLSVFLRARVDGGKPGEVRVRVVVGERELTAQAGQISDETLTPLGPLDLDDAGQGLHHIRLQLAAAADTTVQLWPPWLVWHDSADTPPLAE